MSHCSAEYSRSSQFGKRRIVLKEI